MEDFVRCQNCGKKNLTSAERCATCAAPFTTRTIAEDTAAGVQPVQPVRDYLILKIAAGVFLGGLALLATINGPGWLSEFVDQKNEESALETIRQLSPESVIRKCGQPLKDDTLLSSPPDLTYRQMTYADAYSGGDAIIQFSRVDEGTFSVGSIQGRLSESHESNFRKLQYLPCLNSQ